MDNKGLFLLCEQLANLLGFKVDKREGRGYHTRIIIDEKTIILISLDWRNNSKAFAQCATNKINYSFLGEQIGFSYKRNPVGISNDIKRRLLKDLDHLLNNYIENENKRKAKLNLIRNKNDAFLTAHPFLKQGPCFNLSFGQNKYNLKTPIENDKRFYNTTLLVTPEQKNDFMDIAFGRIPDKLAYKLLECFRDHYDPNKKGKRVNH